MLSKSKQLEIMEVQLNKALDIVLAQKRRYEKINSQLTRYNWTCEEDGRNNEVSNGILGAIGNIECAIENMYNE